jgi:hypothetical protein
METLKINKANALKAYKEAPKEGKQLLSNLFGKGVLSENIMERIHDFSDILDEAGISEEEFAEQIKGLSEDEIAYKKMKLFTSVLNEGWGPDWNDSNEYKWYPYFDMGSKSGFGFSNADAGYGYAHANVGSRLCFKSSALAEFAGKLFISIYKAFLTK